MLLVLLSDHESRCQARRSPRHETDAGPNKRYARHAGTIWSPGGEGTAGVMANPPAAQPRAAPIGGSGLAAALLGGFQNGKLFEHSSSHGLPCGAKRRTGRRGFQGCRKHVHSGLARYPSHPPAYMCGLR